MSKQELLDTLEEIRNWNLIDLQCVEEGPVPTEEMLSNRKRVINRALRLARKV